MSRLRKVIIAAGGTGGHVFPALAVADELKAHDVTVIWVGTEHGLESNVVPAWGYPIHILRVSALRSRGLFSRIKSLGRLLVSTKESFSLLKREQPQAVLGMGGYVAGPVCVAARLCSLRTILHEQNAVAGFTNKIIKSFATKVLEAVPGTFAARVKAVHTGNPVRSDILSIASPDKRMQARTGPVRVLVVGGSQGARSLNTVVPAAVQILNGNVSVWHQAGSGNSDETLAAYTGDVGQIEVTEFITDMAAAYEWADLVICRAGAMTIAEIAAAGVASVLIPYPYAVDDHQTANGQYLVEAGAATMIQESVLDAAGLAATLKMLTEDRNQLITMAMNASNTARRDATKLVVAEILGVTT